MTDKTIDPARVGLSKSLMTTPCERRGYYAETVRDAAGRRLRFPMPERVTFGRAIDAATAYVVEQERGGLAWRESNAVALALMAAEDDADSWALVDDKATFGVQVRNAIELYVGQPEGLAKMRERIGPFLRIQGDDGRSLRADDIIGTPDFYDERGPIDVKTSGRTYDARKFYESPEMGVYALLWSERHGGIIPEVLAYHVYVRLVKPRWQWIEVPGNAAFIELGRDHAERWRNGLAAGDATLFGVDLAYCHECGYRDALPDLGHVGCFIGQARVSAETNDADPEPGPDPGVVALERRLAAMGGPPEPPGNHEVNELRRLIEGVRRQ